MHLRFAIHHSIHLPQRLLWLLGCVSIIPLCGAAQGLPEPGPVLYGIIRNLDGRVETRMAAGTLTCRITPPSGALVTLVTNLQNINDQFSYVLAVPFETSLGTGVSINALAMPNGTNIYSVELFVNGVATRSNTVTRLSFSPFDRGILRRLDAELSVAWPDSDGNGLPDWWEALYGQNDPGADPDRDGLKNLGEYRAGTNPLDASSVIAFVGILPVAPVGVEIRWSSITNRSYSIQRSTDLFGSYSLLASNRPASPPANTYRDTTASGSGPFFYRIRLE